MARVVCIGEALIDFVSQRSGVGLIDAPGFEKAPGGAPANVAVALSRLGTESAFVGKVGDDPFGRFLARTFSEAGVDTSRMVFDGSAKTGLAFVSLMEGGERDFTFYRNPSADMLLAPADLDEDFIRGADVLHFGSITLISEPSRSATLGAIRLARGAGSMVSYDPNLRMSLWDSAERARTEMLDAMAFADVVKIAEEELVFLFGSADAPEGARRLMDLGPRVVAVTRAERGCYGRNSAAEVSVAGFPVDSVDTTGAGDGFVAGALHSLLSSELVGRLADLSEQELSATLRLANAVGALATTRKGAIPAMPSLAEAQRLCGASEGPD